MVREGQPGGPPVEEEVPTERESQEVQFSKAMDSFLDGGGAPKDLLGVVVGKYLSTVGDEEGDVAELARQLQSKLEEREAGETKDPFDIKWIAKTLTDVPKEKLKMLDKPEFKKYVKTLIDGTSSRAPEVSNTERLFLALGAVAKLTEELNRSKRADEFKGIERFVANPSYCHKLSDRGKGVCILLRYQMDVLYEDGAGLNRCFLNDIFFETKADDLVAEGILKSGQEHGAQQHFLAGHYLREDHLSIGSVGDMIMISGDAFVRLKKKAQKRIQELLPVINYCLALKPDRHGYRSDSWKNTRLGCRISVDGALESKSFFDLYEENGVLLLSSEGSDDVNALAEAAYQRGLEDFDERYKTICDEQVKRNEVAGYKKRVWGNYSDYQFRRDENLEGSRNFYRRPFYDSVTLDELEKWKQKIDATLYPFLAKCVITVEKFKKDFGEIGTMDQEEIEGEMIQSEQYKAFEEQLTELKEGLSEYDRIKSSWGRKKQKLEAQWEKIFDLKKKCGENYVLLRNSSPFNFSDRDFFPSFLELSMDRHDQLKFDDLKQAVDDFDVNEVLEGAANQISDRRTRENERKFDLLRAAVDLYQTAYDELQGYMDKGLELTPEQLERIKIGDEILEKYGRSEEGA